MDMGGEKDQILKISYLARALGVSEKELRRAALKGKIPCLIISKGFIVFSLKRVECWLGAKLGTNANYII